MHLHATQAGNPPTYDQNVRSALIGLARTKPISLEFPFNLWTLERIQTAFLERQCMHLSESTIWEWVAMDRGTERSHLLRVTSSGARR